MVSITQCACLHDYILPIAKPCPLLNGLTPVRVRDACREAGVGLVKVLLKAYLAEICLDWEPQVYNFCETDNWTLKITICIYT